jgi:hypothetical protein
MAHYERIFAKAKVDPGNCDKIYPVNPAFSGDHENSQH